MPIYILTSMFRNGFGETLSKLLKAIITKHNKFVFVASEFEIDHEKNDKYFTHWLNMLEAIGIEFENACVVDGRMTHKQA